MILPLLRRLFGMRAFESKLPLASSKQQNRFRPEVDGLEQRLVPTWSFTDLNTTAPAALLQNLTNGKETVANITYTGDKTAAALFTDTNSVVGFNSGIILSSGKASSIAGPNSTSASSTDFGGAGDPDLDNLISVAGNDASVLTFDYTPKGSFVYFTYVFGSDEYPEFAPPNSTSFNDVFAFFVNNINVSKLPGTNIAVSVGNVNPVTNTKYYVDNTSNTHNTQMDGYTKVLTVTLPVVPGKLNKVKLAVEDAFDGRYDSWVMIKTGSLQSFVVQARGPVRYTYNGLYSGQFLITNSNPFAYTGTAYLVFDSLPPGVTVANKTGLTPSGKPYIAVTGGFKAYGSTSVNVTFSNPLKANLALFFQTRTTSVYVTTELF